MGSTCLCLTTLTILEPETPLASAGLLLQAQVPGKHKSWVRPSCDQQPISDWTRSPAPNWWHTQHSWLVDIQPSRLCFLQLFRSEEMQLMQLLIPAESAHQTITALGEVGMLQFKDLNADKSAFQRTYANQVGRRSGKGTRRA